MKIAIVSMLAVLASHVDGYFQKSHTRYNQVQYRGTHNSFKKARDFQNYNVVAQLIPALPPIGLTSEDILSLFYGQAPLEFQLEDQAIRHLELDIYSDKSGGLFTQEIIVNSPVDIRAVQQTDPRLQKPGFKVLHLPDFDFATTCVSFIECLKEVKKFSRKNPRHLPITITLQPRELPLLDPNANPFPFDVTIPEAIDQDALQLLEDEILSVFDKDDLFTPGKLIDGNANIQEALDQRNPWPFVDDLRGKVVFNMNYVDRVNIREDYLKLKNQKEALIFLMDNITLIDENTAFITQDVGGKIVQKLAKKNFVVRSLPDRVGSGNEFARLKQDFLNGVHLLASDFPLPATPEMVQFRIDPLNPSTARENTQDYFFLFDNQCNAFKTSRFCRTKKLELGVCTTGDIFGKYRFSKRKEKIYKRKLAKTCKLTRFRSSKV